MELLVIAILLTVASANESQLEGPKNTLSVVGSNVTLKCSSSSRSCHGIDWQIKTPGSLMYVFRDSVGIFGGYTDRYSVNNSSGCHLNIKPVELIDAGRFICTAIISKSQVAKSAHLIVLKTQPKCTTNASLDNTVERDGVQLICDVTHNGGSNGSVLWKGVEDAPVAVENGKTISRFFSVVASAPEVPSFTCETSFAFETNENGAPIKDLATNNLPVATCATSAIRILYSVRDVTLSSSLSNYFPGTIITCTAEGNPSPTFKWQEMENDGTWMDIQYLDGSEFTVSYVSSKWYRCVAMNVVRGKSNNATSGEIQFNNTHSVSIWVGVGVGFLLLIIFLVVCFGVRPCPGYQYCHSEKKSKDKMRVEQPLTENPDICIYSVVEKRQDAHSTAKPSAAPTSEAPERPQDATKQATPRTDNLKAGPTNTHQHEEVTYAELAKETGTRQVVPKYNHVPQETLYSDVGAA